MITFHHQAIATEADDVQFHCPACNQNSVTATPSEAVDEIRILYLIPIFKLRNTSLRCSSCQQDVTCMATMNKIASMGPDEITSQLRWHASGKGKIVSALALLLSWFPFLGLGLAIASIIMNRGTQSWASAINVLSMIIACVSTIITALMLVMPPV